MATWPALHVELLVNGTTWTDITSRWYQRDRTTITRGRRDEGSTADFGRGNLTLNNRDGALSPRNPNGTWFGQIGRNTQLRISEDASSSYLDLRTGQSYANDTAAISVTGDIDIRWDGDLTNWRYGANLTLVTKDDYGMYVNASDGTIFFFWTDSGSSNHNAQSTLPVPAPISGRRAIRATMDVNNGASGRTITFYTSDTISGTWTQLGDAVVQSGTTSIKDTTHALSVSTQISPTNTWAKVYAVQVRNGIAGSIVANPDFTAQSHGATSFTDSTGLAWNVSAPASIVKRTYLLTGEVAEWPVEWDLSGRDVYTPVTAAGIMRRLGQSSGALRSAYYRGCTRTSAPVTSLVAYWPMEDESGAIRIASGLPGKPGMDFWGVPTLATDSTFDCSAPLPKVGAGAFSGRVKPYAATGSAQVRMLILIPAAGTTNGAVLMRVNTTGTAARWDIVYSTGGVLVLNAYDAAGTSLLSTYPGAFNMDGRLLRLGLSLSTSGSDVSYSFDVCPPGSTGLQTSGTLAGRTVGIVSTVEIGSAGGMTEVVVGHVTVQSATTGVYDLADLLAAYSGEAAGSRAARLCVEEGITYRVLGNDLRGRGMGPQRVASLLTLLREVEATDGGLLFEPPDFLGIGYQTLRSLAAQTTDATLSYTAGTLSNLGPVEDDQQIQNRVTAQRSGGSSATIEATSGPLSVSAPPDGVGQYESSISVNPSSDNDLDDLASWAVHVGTVDEPRYPDIVVKLARPNYRASASLTSSVAGLDMGSRLDVTNPPAWMRPETIRQMVIGTSDSIGVNERTRRLVCRPASPYDAGVWGVSRLASPGSTINGAHTAGDTTLSVATVGGTLWGHGDGNYTIELSTGEQCTVTGVSGSSSPQILTVTRATNGIGGGALAGGETVQLADRRYWVS